MTCLADFVSFHVGFRSEVESDIFVPKDQAEALREAERETQELHNTRQRFGDLSFSDSSSCSSSSSLTFQLTFPLQAEADAAASSR